MKAWLLILPFSLLLACNSQRKSSATSTLVTDGKIWSSLFQQRAAEYKALCLQAFNIATWRVDEATAKTFGKPMAIVTDIDETFLDNSPYAVQQAQQGKDYEPASWFDWTARGSADTLAGALGFFRHAADLNIEIFYITNREEKERAGTLKNLQDYHFPFADDRHLILKKDVSSKEPRRQELARTHEIILLLGDNLADFSALFDKKTTAERDHNTRLVAAEFGKKFIVLPNFDYGGWEDAIYLNSHSWTAAQKDSLIKMQLKDIH